jgi:hypothetical protein
MEKSFGFVTEDEELAYTVRNDNKLRIESKLAHREFETHLLDLGYLIRIRVDFVKRDEVFLGAFVLIIKVVSDPK